MPKTPPWLHSSCFRRDFRDIEILNKTIGESDQFHTSGILSGPGAPDPNSLQSQAKTNAEKSISEHTENLRIQSEKYASELASAANHLNSLKDLYSSQVESNSVKAMAEK